MMGNATPLRVGISPSGNIVPCPNHESNDIQCTNFWAIGALCPEIAQQGSNQRAVRCHWKHLVPIQSIGRHRRMHSGLCQCVINAANNLLVKWHQGREKHNTSSTCGSSWSASEKASFFYKPLVIDIYVTNLLTVSGWLLHMLSGMFDGQSLCFCACKCTFEKVTHIRWPWPELISSWSVHLLPPIDHCELTQNMTEHSAIETSESLWN